MDRKVVGAAVAVVALVAGGCGSSSKPLTRTAFVQRADAACRRIDAAISRSTRGGRGIVGFAMRLMDADSQIKGALGSLTPPKALQTSLDQYRKSLDARDAYIKQALPLVKARRFEGDRAMQARGQAIAQHQMALARRMGLKVCA
jgi:hypothetical protein